MPDVFGYIPSSDEKCINASHLHEICKNQRVSSLKTEVECVCFGYLTLYTTCVKTEIYF